MPATIDFDTRHRGSMVTIEPLSTAVTARARIRVRVGFRADNYHGAHRTEQFIVFLLTITCSDTSLRQPIVVPEKLLTCRLLALDMCCTCGKYSQRGSD